MILDIVPSQFFQLQCPVTLIRPLLILTFVGLDMIRLYLHFIQKPEIPSVMSLRSIGEILMPL